MKTLVLFAAVLCLTATSCNNTDDATLDSKPLLGTWELSSIRYLGDIEMNTPSNITITISKTAEGLSFTGTSSCNSYLGIINLINTERLRLENIGFTERGCLSEELASFETRYTSILGKVSNYGLEREGLILFFDTTYLIFKPQEN